MGGRGFEIEFMRGIGKLAASSAWLAVLLSWDI
jgi:hypothetical protein